MHGVKKKKLKILKLQKVGEVKVLCGKFSDGEVSKASDAGRRVTSKREGRVVDPCRKRIRRDHEIHDHREGHSVGRVVRAFVQGGAVGRRKRDSDDRIFQGSGAKVQRRAGETR